MADFQTLLDNVAKVIGGTQPDAASRPRWFSGRDVGDSTGIQLGSNSQGVAYPVLTGCYSAPPEAIGDVPVGIVLAGPFEVSGGARRDVYTQGVEMNTDDLRLIILINRVDTETTFTNLAPFRDLIPAALAAKMTAFSSVNVLQAMVRGGKPVTTTWGSQAFDGFEFTIRVIRLVSRTYVG